MVGVCYTSPKQDEESDKVFLKKLGEASQLLTLALVVAFNLVIVFLKYSTVFRKQTVQEVVGGAQQAALHLPAVLVKQGGPRRLEFANVASIYKKGRKEDLENNRPVSLALVLAKVVEAWMPSHSTCRTSQGSAQPAGALEGRSCLIKMFSFYDKVTC